MRFVFLSIAAEIGGATRGVITGSVVVGWVWVVGGCRFRVCSGVEGGGEGRWLGMACFVEDEEGTSLKEVWEGCFGGDDGLDGGKALVETMENG